MGGGGEWNQELRQHPGEVPRSPGRFFLQVGVLAPEEFPESPSWAHSFSPASLNHPFSPLLSDFSLIRLSCPFFLFFKPLPVGFISSLSFLFPVRTVILAMDIRGNSMHLVPANTVSQVTQSRPGFRKAVCQ